MKSYEEIQDVIEKFNYTLPFVGVDDETKDNIVVSEGYEDTVYLYETATLHYYQITYQGENKIEKYYENNTISIEYRK